MIVRTFGEVEVDQGRAIVIRSVMPCTPWRSNVVGDLERVEHRGRTVEHLEQAVVRDHDRRCRTPPASAWTALLGLRAPPSFPLELETAS